MIAYRDIGYITSLKNLRVLSASLALRSILSKTPAHRMLLSSFLRYNMI